MISISFHGAVQTVTGSKYLVRSGDDTLLVDCGIFQGKKQLRLRNWEKPPFDISAVRWVLLTHAHTDHTAYLPRLYKLGFRGRILCSTATQRLAEILLMDAAHIQEEDARYLNKKRATRHKPALPLFDSSDAGATLKLFESVPFDEDIELSPHFTFSMRPVGHILGAGSILLRVSDNGNKRSIYFGGDVGRYDMPLLPDPTPPLECDGKFQTSIQRPRIGTVLSDPADDRSVHVLSATRYHAEHAAADSENRSEDRHDSR